MIQLLLHPTSGALYFIDDSSGMNIKRAQRTSPRDASARPPRAAQPGRLWWLVARLVVRAAGLPVPRGRRCIASTLTRRPVIDAARVCDTDDAAAAEAWRSLWRRRRSSAAAGSLTLPPTARRSTMGAWPASRAVSTAGRCPPPASPRAARGLRPQRCLRARRRSGCPKDMSRCPPHLVPTTLGEAYVLLCADECRVRVDRRVRAASSVKVGDLLSLQLLSSPLVASRLLSLSPLIVALLERPMNLANSRSL